jgi:hypothetical protein
VGKGQPETDSRHFTERTQFYALRSLAVFDPAADPGTIVPALWRLEALNGLQEAPRRGRIDPRVSGCLANPRCIVTRRLEAITPLGMHSIDSRRNAPL